MEKSLWALPSQYQFILFEACFNASKKSKGEEKKTRSGREDDIGGHNSEFSFYYVFMSIVTLYLLRRIFN